eukprot:7883070-Pyramimonas_sp.AAC.1
MSKEVKSEVRKEVKAELRKISQEKMSEESSAIQTQILSSEDFAHARTVGVYVHCAKLREVDTSRIVESILAGGRRCGPADTSYRMIPINHLNLL